MANRNHLTLRGLLLTSFGFSEFGTKAAQGAVVAYLAAGLLALLSIAGFVHALVTPKTKAFAVPEPAAGVTAVTAGSPADAVQGSAPAEL